MSLNMRRGAAVLSFGVFLLLSAVWVRSEILAIPPIDWDQIDRSALEVLREQQTQIDELLETDDPDTEVLARAYGSAGIHYHAFGLSSAALVCYLNAASLSPDDLRWSYYLGHLYGDGESAITDLAKAATQYQRALSIHPAHVPSLIALAKIRMTQGLLDQAKQAYERVRVIDVHNAAANLGLGRVWMARGETTRALGLFERANRAQPAVKSIHYALAMAYRALGETNQAKHHLDRGEVVGVTVDDILMSELRSVRTGAPALIRQGGELLRAERFEEAADAFSRATRLDPANASGWLNLGVTRLILEDYAGAVRELARAVDLAPTNATAHYNLGLAYALRGREPAAIRHLGEAVALHPRYARGHLQLGDALARNRQYERALLHYEHSAGLSPGDPLPRFRGAMMLVQLGRSVVAARELESASVLFPASLEIKNALARVLSTSLEPTVRNPVRALEMAQRLPRHSREFAHTATLAMAYASVGDYALALEHLEVAVSRAGRLASSAELAHLQAIAHRYRAGKPYDKPWGRDDPIFHPSVI